MDIDDFFRRAPLRDYPLSMVVRLPADGSLDHILQRAQGVLAGRRGDELILITHRAPDAPARQGGMRIRFFEHPQIDSGEALAGALMLCRRPAIVTVDSEVSLTSDTLSAMLEALEQVDLVMTRRRRARAGFTRLTRWLFAVPTVDPLSSIKAMRRAAVRGIVLQTCGPVVEFELAAKMTFLTSLVDEIELKDAGATESLGSALWSARRQLWSLFIRPRFWGYADADIRPALNAPPPSVPRSKAAKSGSPATIAKPRIPENWGPAYPRLSSKSLAWG